ncbi:MAG TPA: adenylate/guanylate cyclase domain-containing protein [Burkholderiales bacterium]|nr:adenylate/guanylate cyclase domain-containing protein [Burkholderiales bacterium]
MRRGLSLLALTVLAALALELFLLEWMKPLENRLLDSFVRTQAAALAPDPDIVLVDIDEKSLAKMEAEAGRWPWPRVVYADLLEGLAAQKPRAIVFDMMFVEKDRFRPQDDAAFAESAARHGNTYFAFLRLPESSDSKGIRIGDFADEFGLVATSNADPEAKIALVPPLVLTHETHRRAGLITFKEDADGVGRRYLLRETLAGWQIPSLPARVAGDLGFPAPDQDTLVLAWRGAANGFPRVSFADLYEEFGRSAKTRPANEFSGKIVVVGTAATGLQDLRVTPMGSLHPGAEILGTAIENLKNGRHMRYAPAWWAAALGASLLLLLYLAFQRGLDMRATGAALSLVTALLILAQWALVGRLLLWPLLTPLAAAWTFYAAAGLAEYLRARQERQAAMVQFSRFTNPHVAKQLVEQGGIETGRREVTLLFSDIRGFTTLSETRSPEEVIALLNRYFTLQVDVVFSHGGSLDKFIGDCIMAMWGAPLDQPDHARRAVACALDMADTLQVFKRELGAEQSDFDVGIGLHSGPAVVGLMGSQKRRLEYTAIGDTVNLASRIEGLTKDAKRRILVSRDTMEACGGAFEFVSCGTFAVKGRAQPVELFEPRRKT